MTNIKIIVVDKHGKESISEEAPIPKVKAVALLSPEEIEKRIRDAQKMRGERNERRD